MLRPEMEICDLGRSVYLCCCFCLSVRVNQTRKPKTELGTYPAAAALLRCCVADECRAGPRIGCSLHVYTVTKDSSAAPS